MKKIIGIAAASADPTYYLPFMQKDAYSWFALCLTLMLGTAGLPHASISAIASSSRATALWTTMRPSPRRG